MIEPSSNVVDGTSSLVRGLAEVSHEQTRGYALNTREWLRREDGKQLDGKCI